MFTVDELRASLAHEQLSEDIRSVREDLSAERFGERPTLDGSRAERLSSVVDAVLASASEWDGDGLDLCQQAAEIAEMLARTSTSGDSERLRLRATLLYELAGQPSMAGAIVGDDDGPRTLIDFFKRRDAFGSLGQELHFNGDVSAGIDLNRVVRLALCEDAVSLADYEQGSRVDTILRDEAPELARLFSNDLSLSEVNAFRRVVRNRAGRATLSHTPHDLLPSLRAIGFPPELWTSQLEAIEGGLLRTEYDAWALASPTGTGKTFLARLLILDALLRAPDKKILYIVPSKALVYQVARDLSDSLEHTNVVVTAVTPQLVALDADEDEQVTAASVLVLTPEKADLLLRIGAEFVEHVGLTVVDEAHHIEDGTRGVLLELYLARLKTFLGARARYVFLSAVAPNVGAIARWIGRNPGEVLITSRSTRMRVGIYRIRREGRYNQGFIDYVDGGRVRLFERGVETGSRSRLVQLANRLGTAGSVLVVTQGRATSESVAQDLLTLRESLGVGTMLTKEQLESAEMQRLDSRLEREMYATVPLRNLVRHGIAYHHAGLPPRVREALEEAISANHIRFVTATTTLAEGVNFPFSTVVVESLVVREPSFEQGQPMSYRLFTPRKFWNIAGRAGRPGFDYEGQVILFEPSLRLSRVQQTVDPYTRPDMVDIPPVTSALGDGISELRGAVERGEVRLEQLQHTALSESVPRRTQGLVNLIRVGLAHARATGLTEDASEYFENTYAAVTLPESDRSFARTLMVQQQRVLEAYLANPSSASVKLVAELGLSIDTLSRLQDYAGGLQDWQLRNLGTVMLGSRINFGQLPYVVGPVLARMYELEGTRLSGLYSEVVADWCQGKPFSAITPRGSQTLDDLIRVVYSRIQFLLPWGLYAADRFVAEEAERRHIDYANPISRLAYLVDAGVPDLAALRLTSVGFERTDASRLSRAYFSSREARETTDIVSWVSGQPESRLLAIVRGPDNRRVDYDFGRLAGDLRSS